MWQESAEDYRRALNLGAPVDEPQWIGVTALFEVMGYQSELEQLQAKYLSILKEPNSKPKWNVLRSVLISPSEEQGALLAQLAQNWLEHNGPPPHGRRPPREFLGERNRAERLPPFESQYICGLAFLRAGREFEAVRWFRSAAAREWPARSLVDAPLAIALSGQGNQTDALALLEESKRQIDDWVGHAIDIDSVGRKLPWYYLAESIAVNREATHKVYGMWIDIQPQISALRITAMRKLDASLK